MNTVSHAEPESRLFNRNLVHYLGGWALFAFAGQGVMGVLLNLYFNGSSGDNSAAVAAAKQADAH